MSVPVTGLYAGLLSVILAVLTVRVTRRRRAKKIGILDRGDQEMIQAIRVHGNFTEYVPAILILMAALELNGVPYYVIHAMGGMALLSRVSHAVGLSRTIRGGKLRIYGMFGTISLLIAGGVGAVLWSLIR